MIKELKIIFFLTLLAAASSLGIADLYVSRSHVGVWPLIIVLGFIVCSVFVLEVLSERPVRRIALEGEMELKVLQILAMNENMRTLVQGLENTAAAKPCVFFANESSLRRDTGGRNVSLVSRQTHAEVY